jgi:hypothetical protein
VNIDPFAAGAVCAIALIPVAFSTSILVSQILVALQGTEAERALNEQLAAEGNWLGVTPLNQAVWSWLLDAKDLPDNVQSKVRTLRTLRRVMIGIVGVAMVAILLSGLTSDSGKLSFRLGL